MRVISGWLGRLFSFMATPRIGIAADRRSCSSVWPARTVFEYLRFGGEIGCDGLRNFCPRQTRFRTIQPSLKHENPVIFVLRNSELENEGEQVSK